jgi:NitT/TauT family transport system substrate-binding protein
MASFSRATVLAGLTASAAAPSLRGTARAADLAPIRIGAAPTDATAQHLYAQDLGYFTAAGLSAEISPMRSSGALVAAILGGSLDFMTSTVVSIALAHNKGIDLRTVAVGNVYNGPPPQAAVVVAPNSTVRTGADLNGKTLAVNGLGDLTQVALAAWMDANGGDAKTVKMIEVPFSGVAAALAQGRIDAAMLVEPFTSAAGNTVKILGDPQAAIGRGYMVTGWYAKADWLNANHDTAKRFIDVMLQTAKWGNRNHDLSAAILAKYVGLTADVIKATPRAVYGEQPVTPAMIQPVLDFSTKYIDLPKTSAASLIWKP